MESLVETPTISKGIVGQICFFWVKLLLPKRENAELPVSCCYFFSYFVFVGTVPHFYCYYIECFASDKPTEAGHQKRRTKTPMTTRDWNSGQRDRGADAQPTQPSHRQPKIKAQIPFLLSDGCFWRNSVSFFLDAFGPLSPDPCFTQMGISHNLSIMYCWKHFFL